MSLTGGSCALSCSYCSSHYISSMEGAMSIDEFEKAVRRMNSVGVNGFLVSGGFDREGSLHLSKYIPVMRKLKRELGVIFNVHPGLQTKDVVEDMSDAVDMVDFEFTYTEKSIREKGLNRKPEDYLKMLEILMDRGPKYVIPHVMVGIPGDEPESSIRIASSFHPYLINLLVLIPTKGTPSESYEMPKLEDVVKAMKISSSLNKTSLGCMRPYPMKKELDKIAMNYVDRIANPHPSLRDNMEMYDACCSLPEEFFDRFRMGVRK
ncbi:radical SAM protein [Sulfuracidifex metallicus]|uniref:radical SAM protein n=1 Tax=Sulfuracidifex metallicus TaxID=47303 RepID=UPI002108FF0B|nr:radical SAM protein [Sulfuracidifex metallicus]WOE51960.1 radical SAM protein [Sulfuracidifex metallicus DSM 6482 = JCM 9184]